MSTRSNLNAGDGPVIVGYDGGPRGRDALALGVSVADALHSRLEVATVFRSETVVPAVPVQERALQAARLAREGVRRIAAVREAEPRVVAARSTVQGLHALAEAEDAAVLVVGTGDRTAPSPVFADTVATQLLSGARCPVAVAPSGLSAAEAVRLRNIGVAFDGSPEACTELQRAAELAQACGGRICVIHALDPPVEPMRPLENARRLERHRVLYQMALDETIASMPENVPADSRVFVGPAPKR
jgi:nucleotide-binding universal stress UspA family protein